MWSARLIFSAFGDGNEWAGASSLVVTSGVAESPRERAAGFCCFAQSVEG